MGRPSVATMKMLYACSGNRCAFPGCLTPMVDFTHSPPIILGEACHIKGNRPGGPRHDPAQTEAERQGFANLLLMCGRHNKTIDEHEDLYTPGSLAEMKENHEGRFKGMTPPPVSDDLLDKMSPAIVNAQHAAIVLNNSGQLIGGSWNFGNVSSHGQTGGITAGVVNIGERRLKLPVKEWDRLVALAAEYAGTQFTVDQGGQERDSAYLAYMIRDCLVKAGWITKTGVGVVLPPGSGVLLNASEGNPAANAICQWFKEVRVAVVTYGSFRKMEGVYLRVGMLF